MSTQNYPGVVDRVKASFGDTLAIIGFMIIFSYTFSHIEDVPDNVRIICLVFVFFLYVSCVLRVTRGRLPVHWRIYTNMRFAHR